jgi:hypothetical protein
MPFGKLFAALKGNHKAAMEEEPVVEPTNEAPANHSAVESTPEPEQETAAVQVEEDENVVEPVMEVEEEGTREEDEHERLEKAIFDSRGGFGDDWTEEADWGSTPAPAELENEDGWTMKKAKPHTKSKRSKGRKYQVSQKPKPVVKKEEEKKPDTGIAQPTSIHALLATMDDEDELGVELAVTDDDSEEEQVEQHVEEPQADVVPESKPKAPVTLSKKEKQELKKKELEDLDAMLAELGVETESADKTANNGESSKAAKRRAKKERKAANGAAQGSDSTREQSGASSDADVSGPAIDPDAIKAAKTALKKKAAPKKLSAAQAAAKAAAAKGKKKSKDTSKFNELYGR